MKKFLKVTLALATLAGVSYLVVSKCKQKKEELNKVEEELNELFDSEYHIIEEETDEAPETEAEELVSEPETETVEETTEKPNTAETKRKK